MLRTVACGARSVDSAFRTMQTHMDAGAGFYASEEALLREIEVRGPERHSSPAPHGERAPSTVASSEDGDRAAQPAATHRLSQRKGATARRGGPAGKAGAAADARGAIRLADPVRRDRTRPQN